MSFEDPTVLSLCSKVILIAWSLPLAIDGQCTLSGSFGEAITPLSTLRLATETGGTRLIFAFARPRDETATFMIAAGGLGGTAIEYARQNSPQVNDTIYAGLTGAARLSLTAALVTTWPGLFQLQRNQGFLVVLRTLLRSIGTPSPAVTLMQVNSAVVFETAVSSRFGASKSGYIITDDMVRPFKPKAMAVRGNDKARGIRRFFCEQPVSTGNCLMVLRGENGLLVREWSAADAPPSAETWWRKSGGRDAGLRQECIALFNAHSPATRASSIEFQMRCPIKPAAVAGSASLPSAQIELALAGPSGTLFGGWYRDPSEFIDGLDLLGDDDNPVCLDAGRVEFSGKIAGPDKTAINATGFIGFAPEMTGPLLQPRFLLRLKSGVRHLLTPPVQPLDWPTARASALRAVPPQALSDHILANCLAPVLQDYQRAAQASIGQPIVKQIGTPVDAPAVSIIIPLYRVLDFLPFQIAAFASDPQILFRCEIIYVLDSPDQADVVEHMLTGLHLVYGIPITLAVMPRNGGYAIANNRGAALARGAALTLLNSDVIPIKAGWVGELASRLMAGRVGAVGPKLLFEDDSIQHAGLFFDRDFRGRWLNHHYYKGMPRHYRPANEERSVPGVTGACIVMARELFEAVGGFTEDYVIGDYEDSDLCLKVRNQGCDIVYVPSAELYHLERRSMTQNGDYVRGVASQYNSWLHEQRWGDAMAQLMATGPVPTQQQRRVA